MSWLWGPAINPQYEELVEKACSPLNLPYPQSEDISVNLEITDMIRAKTVQPKLAMQSLKRRVASKNGRVQMYAIGLIDTCIKNGGDHFLAEIASKEFVDEMSGVIKSPTTVPDVKQMALKHFQLWALAFKSKQELSFFVDVYNELKGSGITFPPPPSQTSSHLLDTSTAPAWVDSDVCMRCRAQFTFTNRKHHCRNCGQVFDQACSSKAMPLPRYGITEDVRVCEGCWTKSGKGRTQDPPVVPGRTRRTKADVDADLQRAIELSLAESQPGGSTFVGSEPPLAKKSGTVEDDDEELRLAIEASLREMDTARPSAPYGSDEPEYKPLPTFDLTGRETETILTFSNTMDQMAAYGERDLHRFPYAHVLAEQAYAVGGKLHRNAEEKATKQQMLAEMQDKLSQAVGLYGQILDGQQAYNARKLQEQQQRQYHQHQQYQHHQQQYQPQQQQYSPYPSQQYQSNGYPTYNAYPAQQYQPPPAQAGPSLYPSMPFGQADYAPPPQQQQQYQPYQYQGYNPQQQPPAQQSPVVNGAPAQTSAPDSQYPYQQRSHPAMLGVNGRQASLNHSAETQVYSAAASAPMLSPGIEPPTQGQASAPPPVDIASHPASSPRSTTSRLASHTSPTGVAVPLPSSPEAQWQAQQAQAQYSQKQRQQQPAQVYNVDSFPAAPAAVFPDAPVSEPHGLEKKEQEEALLIEL